MYKTYFHDGHTNLTPAYLQPEEVLGYVTELQAEAKAEMDRAGKAHAIYMCVHPVSLESAEIDRIDLYVPPVVLDDSEYAERIVAQKLKYPDCQVYSVHAEWWQDRKGQ